MTLLATVVCAAGLPCALAVLPMDETTVIAVFPPWWSPAQIFETAGSSGQIVSSASIPSIVIIHSDETLLAKRLRESGAWFTIPSFRFAGCGTNIEGTS